MENPLKSYHNCEHLSYFEKCGLKRNNVIILLHNKIELYFIFVRIYIKFINTYILKIITSHPAKSTVFELRHIYN